MSRLAQCNRCGAEREILGEDSAVAGTLDRIVRTLQMSRKLSGWQAVRLEDWPQPTLPDAPRKCKIFDLCEDCAEVFTEQFMLGAEVAPVTKRADQTPLPHDPMTDCQLVFSPKTARFVCYHDDPKLFRELSAKVLQDAIKGVEASSIVELRGTMEQMDEMDERDEMDEEIDCITGAGLFDGPGDGGRMRGKKDRR